MEHTSGKDKVEGFVIEGKPRAVEVHESRAFTESRFTEGKTASRDIGTGELALREIPAKVRNRVTDPRSKIKDSGANRGLALGRQRRCVSYLVFSEEIDIASDKRMLCLRIRWYSSANLSNSFSSM